MCPRSLNVILLRRCYRSKQNKNDCVRVDRTWNDLPTYCFVSFIAMQCGFFFFVSFSLSLSLSLSAAKSKFDIEDYSFSQATLEQVRVLIMVFVVCYLTRCRLLAVPVSVNVGSMWPCMHCTFCEVHVCLFVCLTFCALCTFSICHLFSLPICVFNKI